MNEYRQRALNRVNGTNVSNANTTSTYRQRALNRQQPKVEETPKVEESKYEFTPEDATNLKNILNSRLQRINDKGLSEERIQEIKETSPVLNPEKYHKEVDAGYYGRKAAEGFARAGEGIVDTAKILFGGEENALDAVRETPSANYGKMTDFIYNNASGGHKLAGEVLSSTTAMAPTVAANLALPGLGYGVLGAQAFGSGTQQAYQTTGELGAKEKIYGLLGGLVEVGIEKLSGGIGGLGNGAIDDIASKIIKNGLIRSATGEGIEEAVTTIIDPYLQRLTYDKGAEGAKLSEVLRSAIVGSLTSMLLQGGSAAINLPQTIQENKQTRQEIRNSLEGIEKMLPTYESQVESETSQENATRELPTMASQRAMLPTNRIEGQTAQTGNMEQMVENGENVINTNEFGQQIDDLLAGKRNRKDSLVVLSNTPKIIQELGAEDLPITVTSSKLERIMNAEGKQKKQYHDLGIDIVKQLPEALNRPLNILKSHDNSYVVVTELADKQDRPIIASIKIDGTGRLDNVEILSNVMTSAYGRNNYDDYMQRNIKEGNLVYDIDEGIIKENLNGGARLQLSGTTNEVSNNIVNQNDKSVNTQYAQNKQNDTADNQSAFSMPKNYISPAQDIQKASDFINKATVEDIDTLNKMVEEAEKYPDRVDLQFFAEKAKKKIEYLTKSQRYQKTAVEKMVTNLHKAYGINKAEARKSINKYIIGYNSDGDISVYKKQLLDELTNSGILGEYASNEINNSIEELNKTLQTVNRYESDKKANEEKRRQDKVYYKLNNEAVNKLYELKIEYQKNSDKAMRKILLTKADNIQLDRLLKGEISFDELPKNVNASEIKKAYDAKKPLMDVNQEIQRYNKAIKQVRNDKMKELTANSVKWKDKKSGLAYARETQERNIDDIAPAYEAARIKEEIFEPIHHNEAEATRYKNQTREKIKALDIGLKPQYQVSYPDSEGGKDEKVSESGLVQLYGENKINDEALEKLGVDVEKIKTAVSTFREIYNDLYNKTNEVLMRNGYAPVEFRKDYFPHFEETKPDTVIGKALSKLGFKIDTTELPTDIAGITHTFKPGKKWVSNFFKRTRDVATYDAVKGFDSYLEGVTDVIYHTDDIQNLRAYENALRYQHSDEAVKEQVDEIINMDIASEMKQSMLEQVYETAQNSLAHYVTDLRAYTDNLAGKKSLEDRTMEHNLGRGIYNITKNVQSRVSANMVGANISSALTNFIPLTQATGVIDTKYLLQAVWDTAKNAIKSDGFVEQSDFLISRRGSEKLYKTATDKLAEKTNIMSLIDNITSEIINRGRYYQNVANGMDEAGARIESNSMSGKILGDRSKGALPTIFNQSSPVTKLLTAFQLEVNNQYSYLLKDIPKEHKDEAIGSLVWAFAKVFLGAWLYNGLYEKMTGRRAALDPIDIVAETVGDVAEGKKASEVALNLGGRLVEEVPFIGGLAGGGRLPISSALPDAAETVKAGISLFEEGDKTKAIQTLASELSKPVFYIVPPFGGGQLKKAIEGISTYAQGGNYGVNSKGEKTLKYPVEQTPSNLIKSGLFGKWATEGAKDYIDRGFKPLSVNQTEAYEKAIKAGISSDDFFKAYDAQRGIEGDKDRNGKTIENSKSKKVKEAIDKATSKLTSKQRKILYDAFNVSKTVQGGSGLPTQSELRGKLPKVEIKIEK